MTNQTDAERLAEIAQEAVDCWGVGKLNITAFGEIMQRMRALLLDAATSRQEEVTEVPAIVLVLASYCGDDNPSCTNNRPCADCLTMCNVFEAPLGTYLRQLGEAPRLSAPIEAQIEAVARAIRTEIFRGTIYEDRQAVLPLGEADRRNAIAALSARGQGAVCKDSLQGAESIGQGEDEWRLGAEIAAIPNDWALDHLCDHYRVADGRAHKTGGATCKLATDGGGKIEKVQAEGETLAEAVHNAAALARHASRQAGKR